MSRCSSCHRYYKYCQCQNYFDYDKHNYGLTKKYGLYLGSKKKKEDKCEEENKCDEKTSSRGNIYHHHHYHHDCGDYHENYKLYHNDKHSKYGCNHKDDVHYPKLNCRRKYKGKVPKFNYFTNTHGLISDHCLCLRSHTKEHIHNRKCCYQNSAQYFSGIIDYGSVSQKCAPNVHCKHYYH